MVCKSTIFTLYSTNIELNHNEEHKGKERKDSWKGETVGVEDRGRTFLNLAAYKSDTFPPLLQVTVQKQGRYMYTRHLYKHQPGVIRHMTYLQLDDQASTAHLSTFWEEKERNGSTFIREMKSSVLQTWLMFCQKKKNSQCYTHSQNTVKVQTLKGPLFQTLKRKNKAVKTKLHLTHP